MDRHVTIVMYHYVRDLMNSRYPEIKGLDVELFQEQIRYIKQHYNVISGPDLVDAVLDDAELPPRPLLLTFDDGYMDHFTSVFPTLDREGLPGCFFPPAKCVLEGAVLDVNKIHFVLASAPDKAALVAAIRERIDSSRERYDLESSDDYWEALGTPGRYDSADVMFCKRTLQHALPLELRSAVTDELFRKYVTSDEVAFSHELYMNPDQIRVLQHHGMYIGPHGYDHFWLDKLTPAAQEREVDRSLDLMRLVGAAESRWIMCFPYGAYNDSLLSILRDKECAVGLTTRIGIANLDQESPLTLSRLDTNDLPTTANAEPNAWTTQVLDADAV